MIVRSIARGDGADFLAMQYQLDKESQYMLLMPEERTTTVEEMERHIADTLLLSDFLFVALDDDGRISGYIQAERNRPKKIKHSAYIVIGLLEKMQRKGIGTAFFEELVRWAEKEQVTRLELTVITENTGAVALYEKAGFEIEGTKRRAIFQNGAYMNEYYMAKLLN
ncbi:GNAT family N-acetyltransferase [Enterococcus larvae]|uniref:GNAT family N-acetyltransferase n=1 Tax=Enterococcus larvae TaxID=2794352 RepID=UPI003F3640E7